MTWEQIEGKWMEYAGSANAHWRELTDDDWQAITGKKEQLVARVQARYGISLEEADRQVEEWSSALLETNDPVKARHPVEPSAKQRRMAAAQSEPSGSKC